MGVDENSRLAVLEHRISEVPKHTDLRDIEDKAAKNMDAAIARFSHEVVEKMGLQAAQFDTKIAELKHALKTQQADMFAAFEEKIHRRREEYEATESERKAKQQQLALRVVMVVGALLIAMASGGDALSWLRFLKLA